MALLSVEAVSKSFGGIDALRDVSFSVHEGQIKALIGPNGAGKTTLFNIASGPIGPSAGRVMFAEVDVGEKPSHHMCRMGLGRTFQHSQLFDEMTRARERRRGSLLSHQGRGAVGGVWVCRCTGGRSARRPRWPTRR